MKRVLVPEGFSAQGSTFHRVTVEEFVETINLQAGLRSLAGKSAVNLGIYIPEVHTLIGGAKSVEEARLNKTPKEFQCEIRQRLSLLRSDRDQWFERSDAAIREEIVDLLLNYGMPYFSRYRSLTAIAAGIRKAEFKEINLPWATRAAVFVLLGEKEEARLVLLKQHARNPGTVGAYASKLGISL